MYLWMRYPGLLLTLSVTYTLGSAQDRVRVTSPDGRNRVTVEIRDGALAYSVDRDDRAVLLPSHLGFAFQGAPPLRDGLRMVDTSRNTVDETWTQPWGEVDPLEPSAARPLGDAVLVLSGQRARQRADTAHDGDAGRPHVYRHSRGESGRLRADVLERAAHAVSYAARGAGSLRRWDQGA